MNNTMKKALLSMLGAVMMDDNCFGVTSIRSNKPKIEPKINKTVEKELHLFNIGGREVMAYSRKDAIKRLGHGRKQSK